MVETRSKKKRISLHKKGITSISNDSTTKVPNSSSEEGFDPVNKDMLSELSEEILVHILSFLPTEDAVRTLLLRRFGNLWTLLPTLVFVESSPKFIANVMKYHKSPTIDRWEIFCDTSDGYELLPEWVGVALKKRLKVLNFFSHDDFSIVEQPQIFTSQTIVTLKILNFAIDLPHRVNMGSLRRLELSCVALDEQDLKVLEVGCPCLQELFIYHPSSLVKIHFTAPNIERLELVFYPEYSQIYSLDCPNLKFLYIEQVNLDRLNIIDVSSISHAKINLRSPNAIHDFEILHKKFQNAKFFLMHDIYFREEINYIKFGGSYSADRVSMQLEQCENGKQTFQRNTWLQLALKSGLRGSCHLSICRLLRNSRYLEELILYVDVGFFCDCNMLMQELSSPCKMRYLKTITIRDFEKPCKTLVQLIKFLLKSAVILDKLVIVCNKNDQLTSTKGVEFILELLSLPRASQNASVIVA